MFRSSNQSLPSLWACLVGLALVLGLSGVVWGLPPGPPEEVPPWLVDLIDRLEAIEAKIDNQSTDLRGVTQNWDKKLDATNGDANGCNSNRFTCLWGDTAVRDNETGLVWDRDPDTNTRNWYVAISSHCGNREVGGRKGWSVPMREQLATLVDLTGTGVDGNGDPLKLPDGNPFLNVQSASYWSATTAAANPSLALVVDFGNGVVSNGIKGNGRHAWCVRGGQAYDGQDVQQVIDALP